MTDLDLGDLPRYGSRAWLQLTADDPKRAAAILVAAEQWRRHHIEQRWLDELGEYDPVAWWQEVTRDADAEAVKLARHLRGMRTQRELRNAASKCEAIPVRASNGWPPVAVPGRPGWRRCLVNGQQTDLNSAPQETAA
ncbi:hypothetical protein K7862_19235 [Streptomyces sp. PLK6-54]|uniref:DUF2742 domain-containing protein n=1 Tax=Actinacidiphila acidipaludis TaxID=2873382 RepID=A0ABS7Q9E8_9ACTN|nr:hypothetical protein [Streptomyces acidipaludis]